MKHRSLVLIAGALLAVLALPLGAALPAYMAKPGAWTSKLVTDAGPFVTDAQLAQWVQAAQGNPPRFSFLGAFHQCYGGGFLTELANKGVVKFGANSASRYFEPAYYDLDPLRMRSYFTWAWGWRARNPAMGATDFTITDDAYTLLGDGDLPGSPPVPDNPFLPWENAQYLSDRAMGGPPERIAAAQHNYAILFVGRPDIKDQNDTTQIFNMLTAYGIARGDIYILYGPGGPGVGVAPWAPVDAAATSANLQAAFANWLTGKLNAQPPGHTAQVFFWGGDHGAADFPILISADNASMGVAGSGVNNRVLGGLPVGRVVYEAGGGTNRGIWDILGGGDVDAIAFSEMSVPQWFDLEAEPESEPEPYPDPYRPKPPGAGGWVYFSVDRPSQGAPGSDVNREIAAGRSAAADVYTMTQNSNRLAYDAIDSLGLRKLPMGNDELDALSLRNTQTVLHPATQLPNRPFFFSFLGSSEIWVFDPATGAADLYYDFLWSFDDAPNELDALALWDDGARDPATNLLYFDPWSDRMLFSVGRGENAFPWNLFQPCDILKLGPDPAFGSILTQWRFCRNLGLVQGPDNLDALDLGIGREGQPVPDYPEDEYDMYPPGEWPPYPPSPGMIPPGNPYSGSHTQVPPFIHPKQTVKNPPPPPPGS